MGEKNLTVEYEELMARAAELDEPMPDIPSQEPLAPSFVRLALNGAEQLQLSTNNIRLYLRTGQKEWARLAELLRNAAKAYDETGEQATKAVAEGTDVAAALPDAVEGLDTSGLGPTPKATSFGALPAHKTRVHGRVGRPEDLEWDLAPDYWDKGYDWDPTDDGWGFDDNAVLNQFYDVWEAANDMEDSDQGAALKSFIDQWNNFQLDLQYTANRFRPFDSWEGASKEIVESAFEQQRSWIYQMVGLCRSLADQAGDLVEAQRYGYQEHPTTYSIALLNGRFYRWSEKGHPDDVDWVIKEYDEYQRKSEEVMAEYAQKGRLPLPPVNPVKPPTGSADLPDIGDGGAGGGPGLDSGGSDGLDVLDDLEDALNGLNTPSLNGAEPDTAALTSALSDALSRDPVSGLADPSVKAASVGAGGAMPLKPPIEHGAAVSQTAAGSGAGSASGAGAAGTGRGMGGGMAPMGGGAGQGQQGAKAGKRAQKDDEALYSEKRSWTEPVIGNRRRADTPA